MAGRGKPLTIKPSWIKWNGEYVPLASLTPEQKAQKVAEYTERVARTFNNWVKLHPEDYDKIVNASKNGARDVNSGDNNSSAVG